MEIEMQAPFMTNLSSPARRGVDPTAGASTVLHINNFTENQKYHFPSNYIRTTKYTLFTFIPLNMWEQFSRLSNLFFLINMIISLIPGLSPVFPMTTILPLVVVVSVSSVRDALEDLARYQSDVRANNSPVVVVRDRTLQKVTSKDVIVGSILYLTKDQEIPSDTLVLATSMNDGECFVETANLDGETNRKPKCAVRAFSHNVEAAYYSDLRGTVTCDAPNENLRKWEGKIETPHHPNPIPVNLDNLLLRGCVLKNCEWLYGVVIYTGVNTKMLKNLIQKPPKRSRLDKKLNSLILMILVVQQCMILLLCGLGLNFDRSYSGSFYFAGSLTSDSNSTEGIRFVKLYLTYFVLFGMMMPISLFVSMEFCKTAQAKFMEWDAGMRTSEASMRARTSSLNEELSQVQYIFSDKTGTLTENQMRFAKCFVGERVVDELTKPGSIRRLLLTKVNPECVRDCRAFFKNASLV
eukprot:PhF_6_TR10576/c0_g1_i2/m.16864